MGEMTSSKSPPHQCSKQPSSLCVGVYCCTHLLCILQGCNGLLAPP